MGFDQDRDLTVVWKRKRDLAMLNAKKGNELNLLRNIEIL